MKVAIGRNVKYWRPCASGMRGEKGWYLGKVHTLKQVTFPSGQSRVVVGLNSYACAGAEELHFVNPALDITFVDVPDWE